MFKGSTLKWAATVVAIAVIATAALSAGPALAAKGGAHGSGGKGGGGGASITLNEQDPHLGDWVTFTTSGGSQIHLQCSQGIGNYVYNEVKPVGSSFLLGYGDSQWQSGSATCYAHLYSSNNRRLASTIFFALGAR